MVEEILGIGDLVTVEFSRALPCVSVALAIIDLLTLLTFS